MRPFVTIALLSLAAGCAMPVQEAANSEPPVSVASPVSFEGGETASLPLAQRHGERLGTVLGCNSCHGEDYQGGNYADDPDGGFIFASNLTRRVPELTNEQLVKLMREGVHPRREALWYMPAKTLQRLSDADMQALVLFLRTLQPEGRDWPLPQGGEATEALLDYGIIDQSPTLVQRYRDEVLPDRGAELALGRYVASVTCAECHGPGLGGSNSAPSLDRVSAMGRDRLAMLLRTGTWPDGSAHGVMRFVAARNLSALTDSESQALLDYLMTLGPPEPTE